MNDASGPRRAARSVQRFLAHIGRALHAVRRVGPGRYPGSITRVELTDSGDLRIEGFAHIPGEVVDVVVVAANGVVAGATTVELSSPDIAGARPDEPAAARSGWCLVVPGGSIPGGTVELSAHALTRSGLAERLAPVTWTLPAAPRPVGRAPVTGHFDAPVAVAREDASLVLVNGWVTPARAVDRIEVFVDDAPAGAARLFCAPRPDLVDRFGDPTSGLAGFWHLAELAAPPGATIRVRVQAATIGGPVPLGGQEAVVATPPSVDDDDRAWVAALRARAELAAESWVPGHGVDLLVVTHDLGIGGAQLWLQEILRRMLAEDDVTCTVIAPADGPLRRELEARGARVHVVGAFPSQAGEYESTVRTLTQIAADAGSNVALVNSLGSFVGVDTARRRGIPTVLAIHEHYPLPSFLTFAFAGADAHVRARARASIADADAVCFVADATRRLYERSVGAREGHFIHVPHGIDASRFAPASPGTREQLRAAHGFTPDDFVLLNVGSAEGRKGQSNLVLAFDRIAASHPEAQLVLVGMHATPYALALRLLVDGLGLARRVRLVDTTADVVPWYSMADALVLASDAESLPSVLLEAMAARVPVVATDVGGVAEIVRDGETGILCAPRDVAALAEGLRRMLVRSAGDRRALAERAGALVAGREVETYVARYRRLLRALAKDPSVTPDAALHAG